MSNKKTILLIGSTGNGKSTLGSYLFNPDMYKQQPVFRSARSNVPETKNLQTVEFEYDNFTICMIDTPGLNESELADIKNMISIVEILLSKKSISAILICIRLSNNIDTQFKQTIQYYSTLFRNCMYSNTFVIVTDVKMDERSRDEREIDGYDLDEALLNIQKELKEVLTIEYLPSIYAIDSKPYSDEERQISLEARRGILNKILEFHDVPIGDLKFAKTKEMKDEDMNQVFQLHGQIKGYADKLVETQKLKEQVSEIIISKKQVASNINIEINKIRDQLLDWDSEQLVQVGAWSKHTGWKLFQKQVFDFKLTSSYEIKHIYKNKIESATWDKFEADKYTVKGQLRSGFNRGMQAEVVIYTHKKVRYANEIIEARNRLHNLIGQQESISVYLEEYKQQEQTYSESIQDLEQYIDKLKETLNELSSDYLPLHEAKRRLEEKLTWKK